MTAVSVKESLNCQGLSSFEFQTVLFGLIILALRGPKMSPSVRAEVSKHQHKAGFIDWHNAT